MKVFKKRNHTKLIVIVIADNQPTQGVSALQVWLKNEHGEFLPAFYEIPPDAAKTILRGANTLGEVEKIYGV